MGATLSSEDDLPQRDRWARLRFAIIGPLLAAPPAAGELHDPLNALAAKAWRHPGARSCAPPSGSRSSASSAVPMAP
jgi:hypothetical protein